MKKILSLKFLKIFFLPMLFFIAVDSARADRACAKSVGTSAPNCDSSLFNPKITICTQGSKQTNDPNTPKCTKDQQDDGTLPDSSAHQYSNYDAAVNAWKNRQNAPELLSAWIGSNFTYDVPRAKMSNPQPYEPVELFDRKIGICVDLTRFANETLKIIAPNSDPKYLKIDFEPCKLGKHDVSLHWMVQFKKGNKFYFMADSKHPGRTYGPCDSAQEFIEAYQGQRCRKIRCYEARDSYKKTIANENNPPVEPDGPISR
jgi:hypothetical protein